MSHQPEHENQQPQVMTPEEVRQSLLTELEANQQAITELSEEELEAIAGGGKFWKDFAKGFEIGFVDTLSIGSLFIR
jgi:hypothetical protein